MRIKDIPTEHGILLLQSFLPSESHKGFELMLRQTQE